MFTAHGEEAQQIVPKFIGANHYKMLSDRVLFTDPAVRGYLDDMDIDSTGYIVNDSRLMDIISKTMRGFPVDSFEALGYHYPRISLLGRGFSRISFNIAISLSDVMRLPKREIYVDFIILNRMLRETVRLYFENFDLDRVYETYDRKCFPRIFDSLEEYTPLPDTAVTVVVFHDDNLSVSMPPWMELYIERFMSFNRPVTFIVPTLDYFPAHIIQPLAETALNAYDNFLSTCLKRPYNSKYILTNHGLKNATIRSLIISHSLRRTRFSGGIFSPNIRYPSGLIVEHLDLNKLEFLKYATFGNTNHNTKLYPITLKIGRRFHFSTKANEATISLNQNHRCVTTEQAAKLSMTIHELVKTNIFPFFVYTLDKSTFYPQDILHIDNVMDMTGKQQPFVVVCSKENEYLLPKFFNVNTLFGSIA